MILVDSPRCSAQRLHVGVQAAEQEAAVALEPGDPGQVVAALLVEGFRVAGAVRVLHLQQFAAVVECPAVERASEGRLVVALVAADHGAAMATGVDERVQLALSVAGDEDGLTAHERREVIVLVRDLAFMRHVDPVAFEDVLHLEFK